MREKTHTFSLPSKLIIIKVKKVELRGGFHELDEGFYENI